MNFRKHITIEQFNSLHVQQLFWELIGDVITLVRGKNSDRKRHVFEQLTNGQKILFGFMVLHGHTRYGWEGFFASGYSDYLPMIRWGLVQLDAQTLVDNLDHADNLFHQRGGIGERKTRMDDVDQLSVQRQIVEAGLKQDYSEVDQDLPQAMLDAIRKMENYIRIQAGEFVQLI